MVWTFSRGSEQIQVEQRYDHETAEFLLVIEHPGGQRDSRRFGDADAFRGWLSAFEQQLLAKRWIRSGPAVVGPDKPLMRSEFAPEVIATTTRSDPDGAITEPSSHRVVVAASGVLSWLIGRILKCPYCRQRGAVLRVNRCRGRFAWRCRWCDTWLRG